MHHRLKTKEGRASAAEKGSGAWVGLNRAGPIFARTLLSAPLGLLLIVGSASAALQAPSPSFSLRSAQPASGAVSGESDSRVLDIARLGQGWRTSAFSFEKNLGQSADLVGFTAKGKNYALFLTGDAAVIALRNPSVDEVSARVVRLKLAASSSLARMEGEGLLAGVSNYFKGNDP
ncbi:MAG: hypothetical protein ACE5E4_13390, partial [Candidatus Binatia bacterium]